MSRHPEFPWLFSITDVYKADTKEPFYVGKGTQDLTTIPRSLPPLDKETEALLNEV